MPGLLSRVGRRAFEVHFVDERSTAVRARLRLINDEYAHFRVISGVTEKEPGGTRLLESGQFAQDSARDPLRGRELEGPAILEDVVPRGLVHLQVRARPLLGSGRLREAL